MARDSSRDETQKLHKKWLKHQAFMAELAQNKEWLDKIERVSHFVATILLFGVTTQLHSADSSFHILCPQ